MSRWLKCNVQAWAHRLRCHKSWALPVPSPCCCLSATNLLWRENCSRLNSRNPGMLPSTSFASCKVRRFLTTWQQNTNSIQQWLTFTRYSPKYSTYFLFFYVLQNKFNLSFFYLYCREKNWVPVDFPLSRHVYRLQCKNPLQLAIFLQMNSKVILLANYHLYQGTYIARWCKVKLHSGTFQKYYADSVARACRNPWGNFCVKYSQHHLCTKCGIFNIHTHFILTLKNFPCFCFQLVKYFPVA